MDNTGTSFAAQGLLLRRIHCCLNKFSISRQLGLDCLPRRIAGHAETERMSIVTTSNRFLKYWGQLAISIAPGKRLLISLLRKANSRLRFEILECSRASASARVPSRFSMASTIARCCSAAT